MGQQFTKEKVDQPYFTPRNYFYSQLFLVAVLCFSFHLRYRNLVESLLIEIDDLQQKVEKEATGQQEQQRGEKEEQRGVASSEDVAAEVDLINADTSHHEPFTSGEVLPEEDPMEMFSRYHHHQNNVNSSNSNGSSTASVSSSTALSESVSSTSFIITAAILFLFLFFKRHSLMKWWSNKPRGLFDEQQQGQEGSASSRPFEGGDTNWCRSSSEAAPHRGAGNTATDQQQRARSYQPSSSSWGPHDNPNNNAHYHNNGNNVSGGGGGGAGSRFFGHHAQSQPPHGNSFAKSPSSTPAQQHHRHGGGYGVRSSFSSGGFSNSTRDPSPSVSNPIPPHNNNNNETSNNKKKYHYGVLNDGSDDVNVFNTAFSHQPPNHVYSPPSVDPSSSSQFPSVPPLNIPVDEEGGFDNDALPQTSSGDHGGDDPATKTVAAAVEGNSARREPLPPQPKPNAGGGGGNNRKSKRDAAEDPTNSHVVSHDAFPRWAVHSQETPRGTSILPTRCGRSDRRPEAIDKDQ